MLDLYLKYNIVVFEVVFTVTTRHEWACFCDGIGVERRDAASLSIRGSKFDATLISWEEPDGQSPRYL